MRKLAMAMAVVGGLALAAYRAEAVPASKAPDKVNLDECKAKKSGVEFPHKKHMDELKVACDKCHHTDKGLKAGAATDVKKCVDCHKTPEKKETPVCTEMSPKKNPYHIVCVACHQEQNKAGKKAPAKCAECHK